jgi:hypothetical protein
MIDREALEAVLAGAEPIELPAVAGELQGRAFATVSRECRFSGVWDPCFSEGIPPGSRRVT